jgi:hypothetical protein
MGPDEHEKDLRGRPSWRRRGVVAVLACVAIAIPGLALAAGGGSNGPATPQPSEYESPVFNQGIDEKRGDHGKRDCPRKHRDRDGDMRDAARDL